MKAMYEFVTNDAQDLVSILVLDVVEVDVNLFMVVVKICSSSVCNAVHFSEDESHRSCSRSLGVGLIEQIEDILNLLLDVFVALDLGEEVRAAFVT